MSRESLNFYFDPVCPFAWMTSKWVRMVAEQRDYEVDWRFISLRQLNAHIDYDSHFPPEYEAGHTAGLRLLRVAARARAEHGRAAVGPLYAAYGAEVFERGPEAGDVPGRLDRGEFLPIVLAQAFAAALPDDREGLIVNIVDQRVWRPNPQFFSYSLSKAGLWWATQTLAQALAPRIRVNAIGPGPTLPNIHQAPGEFEAEAAGTLLQRRATPDDVTAALRYLIDARAVTGQMIAVDAGQHLGWRTPDIIGS